VMTARSVAREKKLVASISAMNWSEFRTAALAAIILHHD